MPAITPVEEVDATLKKNAAQNAAQYEDWLKSLEEQKRRLAYLQAMEKQFLTTRDIELLKEFKDKREIPEVELAEKVKKPHSIWQMPEDCWLGWLEEVRDDPEQLTIRQGILTNIDAEARLLNPNVKIRHIKGKADGHTYRVYEGIDDKEFNAFHKLRNAERETKQKIEQLISNCTSTNYTTRIEQEKLASSQSPQLPSR